MEGLRRRLLYGEYFSDETLNMVPEDQFLTASHLVDYFVNAMAREKEFPSYDWFLCAGLKRSNYTYAVWHLMANCPGGKSPQGILRSNVIKLSRGLVPLSAGDGADNVERLIAIGGFCPDPSYGRMSPHRLTLVANGYAVTGLEASTLAARAKFCKVRSVVVAFLSLKRMRNAPILRQHDKFIVREMAFAIWANRRM